MTAVSNVSVANDHFTPVKQSSVLLYSFQTWWCQDTQALAAPDRLTRSQVTNEIKKKPTIIPIPPVTQVPTYESDYLPLHRVTLTYIKAPMDKREIFEHSYYEYDLDTEDCQFLQDVNQGTQDRLQPRQLEKMLWQLEVMNDAATQNYLQAAGAQHFLTTSAVVNLSHILWVFLCVHACICGLHDTSIDSQGSHGLSHSSSRAADAVMCCIHREIQRLGSTDAISHRSASTEQHCDRYTSQTWRQKHVIPGSITT